MKLSNYLNSSISSSHSHEIVIQCELSHKIAAGYQISNTKYQILVLSRSPERSEGEVEGSKVEKIFPSLEGRGPHLYPLPPRERK
jgi:hypothetical protein